LKSDPRACLSSLLSYVEADLSEQTFYRSNISTLAISTVLSLRPNTRFSIITAGPVSTQCDGIPRVRYVASSTLTFSNPTLAPVYDSAHIPVGVRSRMNFTHRPDDLLSRRDVVPYPQCTIPPESCANQWATYKKAVKSKMEEGDDTIWLNRMSWDYDLAFFGGCQQPQLDCMQNHAGNNKTFIHSLSSLYSARYDGGRMPADYIYQCYVMIDRFVLLYFPPEGVHDRDICVNDGWGSQIIERRRMSEGISTAIVSEITFAPTHPDLCGYGHQQDFANTVCEL
jgi:hypothetical protein